MARLAEVQSDLPGVDMEEQPVRNYPYGRWARTCWANVGRDPNEDEYEARTTATATRPTTVVASGRTRKRVRSLAARARGGEQVIVNASGALVRRLAPVDPTPGDTLVTTIDWRLQRIVEKNLAAELARWGGARHQRLVRGGRRARSANGRRPCPRFDAGLRSEQVRDGPIDESSYGKLLADRLKPLYDARSAPHHRPARPSRW